MERLAGRRAGRGAAGRAGRAGASRATYTPADETLVLVGEKVVLEDADRRLEGRVLDVPGRAVIGSASTVARRCAPRPSSSGRSPPEALSEPHASCGRSALTKSYGRRVVVREVALEIRQGEVVGPPRPERRGQDDDLLHGRGPDAARQRPGLPRRGGHHRAADVPARAGRDRLPAAGGEHLPQAHRGGERPRDPRDARPARARAARRARGSCSRSWASRAWRASRPTRCPGASGGGSRSAAPSPPQPSFILLDEPFAGIDPLAVIDIQKIIAHLRDRGIGILITDHNVRETLKITDRAYILRDGNVFRSGTAARARLGP